MRKRLRAIGEDVLRETLQIRGAAVPGEHSATISIGQKARKLSELEQAAVEYLYVGGAPQKMGIGGNLIGVKMLRAKKPTASHSQRDVSVRV